MRYIIATIIFCSLQHFAYADIYVICYHSFLGKQTVPYDFSIEEVKEHLEFFKKNGFRFITYRDLISGNLTKGKNILVTIDDGNHSVYNAYFEVFKPMGIKPLLSIYPNIIGKKEYAMNWEQLKRLVNEGCEIASHGFFHLKLNKQLYVARKKEFLQEIQKSKRILEEKLGIVVTSFVYPFGLVADETEKELRNAGYKTGFTIIAKPIKISQFQNQNPFRLGRFMFTRPLAKSHLAHIARLAQSHETKTITRDDDKISLCFTASNVFAKDNLHTNAMRASQSVNRNQCNKTILNKTSSSDKPQKQKDETNKKRNRSQLHKIVLRKEHEEKLSKSDVLQPLQHQDIDVVYRLSKFSPLEISKPSKQQKRNEKISTQGASRESEQLHPLREQWQKSISQHIIFYTKILTLHVSTLHATVDKIAKGIKSLMPKQ
ncbi:MAG: polysaccharide deacetylase family protein [Spirochaetes bacterium]|nr:polysaccharide deacetylase family protein [Spirochaetota bacterium]